PLRARHRARDARERDRVAVRRGPRAIFAAGLKGPPHMWGDPFRVAYLVRRLTRAPSGDVDPVSNVARHTPSFSFRQTVRYCPLRTIGFPRASLVFRSPVPTL